MLLHDKDEGLVVVGVQVSHLNTCFLLLSNPLSLGVEQFDLDVGVRGASDVHLLQFLTLEDANSELRKENRYPMYTFLSLKILEKSSFHLLTGIDRAKIEVFTFPLVGT